MIDLYLKTADEQTLIDALPFLRGVDDDDNPIWITTTHDYTLDIIGTLYNSDDTPIDAFHANLRCSDDIAALVPSEIRVIPPPTNVKRVWL